MTLLSDIWTIVLVIFFVVKPFFEMVEEGYLLMIKK